MADVKFASREHPSFEDASREHVREWMEETGWIIAESFGADRTCEACRTVMRRTDRRQYDGTGCLRHHFTVPFINGAPDPWHLDSYEDDNNNK
ncbi:MAG TPA: hypothetical protein VMX56_04380 [Anaerolineales bacterium]|nr:hypothetical protein [Anaerolineales bacterium]